MSYCFHCFGLQFILSETNRFSYNLTMTVKVTKTTLSDVLLWPDNRIGLLDFWSCIISLNLVYICLWLILNICVDSIIITSLLFWTFSLPFCWMGWILTINRLHDRNHSAWFLLILLIPLVQLWCVVELYFLPGTKGQNRFGDYCKLEPSV
jgi:uncharacterized membrane protein YhaH (DUF805 family)